jgi:hypothetical protein
MRPSPSGHRQLARRVDCPPGFNPPQTRLRAPWVQKPTASMLTAPALEPTLGCAAVPNQYAFCNEHY